MTDNSSNNAYSGCGCSLGSVAAAVLTTALNGFHWGWFFLHAILGWFYVAYALIWRAKEVLPSLKAMFG